METTEQQEMTLKILNHLKDLGHEAVIAGGAVRNWSQGIKANDLDIYVKSGGGFTQNIPALSFSVSVSKDLLCEALGVSDTEIEMISESNLNSEEYATSQVMNILEIKDYKYKGQIFQIITVNGPEMDLRSPSSGLGEVVVDHICTGINKAYIGPDGFIKSTSEFNKDMQDKTITVYTENMATTQYVLTLNKHLPKMIKYYPDYKVKIVTEDEDFT